MLTAHCDWCQQRMPDETLTIHRACLFELQQKILFLEDRGEELEEQLGRGTLFTDEEHDESDV
jgi:hypothetical protein